MCYIVCLIAASLPVCSQSSQAATEGFESLITVHGLNKTTPSQATSSGNEGPIPHITAMVIDAVGVICNSLLIIAILFDPLKVLRKGAWFTIFNLSIADLIAAGSNFMNIGAVKFPIKNEISAGIFFYLWMFGVSASFMLLTFLTIQTYIIVKYPIQSRFIISGKKICLSCLVIWTLATLLGFGSVLHRIKKDFAFELSMKIYISQIAVLELTVVVQLLLKVLIIREIVASARNIEGEAERRDHTKYKEVAKTVVILIVILIVTALPYFAAKQIEYLYKLRVVRGDELIRLFSNYYEPVAVLNFALNPILYSLRLPDYRRSLLALLCKCKQRRDASHSFTSMRTAMSLKSATSLPELDKEMTTL